MVQKLWITFAENLYFFLIKSITITAHKKIFPNFMQNDEFLFFEQFLLTYFCGIISAGAYYHSAKTIHSAETDSGG